MTALQICKLLKYVVAPELIEAVCMPRRISEKDGTKH